MLKDRTEAGKELAHKLESYRGARAIVFALPRGGVVLGREIARALSLPLDIIAIRKIGHLLNPECAIGAVSENGITIVNDEEARAVDKKWLTEEIARQQREAVRRSNVYRTGRKHSDVAGKIAIIVDDGIATGFTISLAVQAIKDRHPEKIIVAVPVASRESVRGLVADGVDDIVLLESSEEFRGAVGTHYEDFEQVSDEEVVRLMNSV